MFFCARPPRAGPSPFGTVRAAVFSPTFSLLADGDANNPHIVRMSSGKQLGHLVNYLQQDCNNIFQVQGIQIRVYLSVEESEWFSISA
jgi:hypothetical protein